MILHYITLNHIKSESFFKAEEPPQHNHMCKSPPLWTYQRYTLVDTPFCQKILTLAPLPPLIILFTPLESYLISLRHTTLTYIRPQWNEYIISPSIAQDLQTFARCCSIRGGKTSKNFGEHFLSFVGAYAVLHKNWNKTMPYEDWAWAILMTHPTFLIAIKQGRAAPSSTEQHRAAPSSTEQHRAAPSSTEQDSTSGQTNKTFHRAGILSDSILYDRGGGGGLHSHCWHKKEDSENRKKVLVLQLLLAVIVGQQNDELFLFRFSVHNERTSLLHSSQSHALSRVIKAVVNFSASKLATTCWGCK